MGLCIFNFLRPTNLGNLPVFVTFTLKGLHID